LNKIWKNRSVIGVTIVVMTLVCITSALFMYKKSKNVKESDSSNVLSDSAIVLNSRNITKENGGIIVEINLGDEEPYQNDETELYKAEQKAEDSNSDTGLKNTEPNTFSITVADADTGGALADSSSPYNTGDDGNSSNSNSSNGDGGNSNTDGNVNNNPGLTGNVNPDGANPNGVNPGGVNPGGTNIDGANNDEEQVPDDTPSNPGFAIIPIPWWDTAEVEMVGQVSVISNNENVHFPEEGVCVNCVPETENVVIRNADSTRESTVSLYTYESDSLKFGDSSQCEHSFDTGSVCKKGSCVEKEVLYYTCSK